MTPTQLLRRLTHLTLASSLLIAANACTQTDDDVLGEGAPGVGEAESASADEIAAPLEEAPNAEEAAAPVEEEEAEAAAAPALGDPADIAYEAPEHWESFEPASSMRLANWTLVGGDEFSGDGVCALFTFAGGGDPQSNLQRWIRQFVDDAGAPAIEAAEQAELIVDNVPTFLLRTEGTFVTQEPPMSGPEVRHADYALVGAVFALETPVFVKCTGPTELISAEFDAITAFVRSFTF